MKTYEEFLVFLDDHLKCMSDFISVKDKNFHAICFATGRFLLSEPYRWETLMEKWFESPEVVKPEKEEMLAFFKNTKGLPFSFRKELETGDMDTLYMAYDILFPILVLKNEFLSSIFREDIRAWRFKKVFRQHKRKIKKVKEFIDGVKNNNEFLDLMRKFTRDLEGYSLTLINNKKLLDQAIKKIEEN
jgi:hypothetical protein